LKRQVSRHPTSEHQNTNTARQFNFQSKQSGKQPVESLSQPFMLIYPELIKAY